MSNLSCHEVSHYDFQFTFYAVNINLISSIIHNLIPLTFLHEIFRFLQSWYQIRILYSLLLLSFIVLIWAEWFWIENNKANWLNPKKLKKCMNGDYIESYVDKTSGLIKSKKWKFYEQKIVYDIMKTRK